MLETLGKYLLVVAWSSVKFIFGPAIGISMRLSVVETALSSILGMMLMVLLVNALGHRLRAKLMLLLYKRRRVFTKRNRLLVRIWRSYGMWGVAALTPVLLSPPVGALLAVSFGERFGRMMRLMFVSALFWAFALSLLFEYVGRPLLSYLL